MARYDSHMYQFVLLKIRQYTNATSVDDRLFLQLRTINLSNDIAPVNSATVVEKRDCRNYRFTMEISNRPSRSIFTMVHGKREKTEIKRMDATFVNRQRKRDVEFSAKIRGFAASFHLFYPSKVYFLSLRFSNYLHLYIAAKYIA